MSRFAQVAAKNLAAAQALIPAVTHHDRADVTAIENLRAAWKAEAHARGVKLTSLAFHVAALARVLRVFPRFNASPTSDGQTLVLKDYVHVGNAEARPTLVSESGYRGCMPLLCLRGRGTFGCLDEAPAMWPCAAVHACSCTARE